MLIPTKHQKLNENLITLGYEVLKKLKRNDLFIEDLFNEFKEKNKDSHIDNFFLTLIFLWLIDAIKMEEESIIVYNK